jgi:predicted Zn-dependent protease
MDEGGSSAKAFCLLRRVGVPLLAWFLCAPLLAGGQQSFDDLVRAASAAREQNDLPGAIQLYSRAVGLNPSWPDGWWYLGLLQYDTNAYAQARDAFSRYIELTPNAAPAIATRGLCEFETGDYATALQDIQHGIALGAANAPQNEKVLRYHEALLLTRTGMFDAALNSYSSLLRLEPPSPEAFVAVGLAGLRKPLLPRDLVAAQQDLYNLAGQAAYYLITGDEQRAQAAFAQLFAQYPSTPNAHYLYAYLLLSEDRDRAVAQLKQELQVAPSNEAALVLLTWTLLLHGDFSTALPYAEKAAEINPILFMAQLVLGRSLVGTGDLKAGVEHLQSALRMQPDNLEIHLALVNAYSKAGRKDEARRERLLSLQISQQEATVAQR